MKNARVIFVSGGTLPLADVIGLIVSSVLSVIAVCSETTRKENFSSHGASHVLGLLRTFNAGQSPNKEVSARAPTSAGLWALFRYNEQNYYQR